MVFYIAVIIFHNQHESNHISMVVYILVIIFHNQHESNHISMVFYFAVIIYDSIIISLTYCFLILALMLYVIATCKSLFFYFLFFFIFLFFLKKKIIKTWVKIWVATRRF